MKTIMTEKKIIIPKKELFEILKLDEETDEIINHTITYNNDLEFRVKTNLEIEKQINI